MYSLGENMSNIKSQRACAWYNRGNHHVRRDTASGSYRHLREWQVSCFQKLKKAKYGIICTPTGAGKSIAILSLVEAKLRSLGKKSKAIIIVPQAFIAKGFTQKPQFVSPDNEQRIDWEPLNNLAINSNITSDSLRDEMIEWMSEDTSNDLNNRVLVCCYATFVNAMEKIEYMNKDEKAKILSNLVLVIDEAHHLSANSDNDSDDDVKANNLISKYISDLYYGQEEKLYKKINLLLVTATFFRGDKLPLISKKMLDSFVRFNLAWDDWLKQMQHLKSFTHDYVFENPLHPYFDGVAKCVDNMFSEDIKKIIIYIPERRSIFSSSNKVDEVDQIVRVLAKKFKARITRRDDGIIVLKRGNFEYKILDLVDENNRDAKKKFFAKTDINTNPDALDCIIALKMFKEGADWQHANGMIITGVKDSLTDLVQMIGRVLRDSNGKKLSKIMQILPFDLTQSPNANVGDTLNNRFKALAAAMLMIDVVHPDIVLKNHDKSFSSEENERETKRSLYSQLPLDENQLKDFHAGVSEAILSCAVTLRLFGKYSTKTIFDMLPRIVRENLEPILSQINRGVPKRKQFVLNASHYEQLAKEIWLRICRAKLVANGHNVADIDWNMISEDDPLDYLMKFVSQPVDGNSLTAFRNMIANSAMETKELLIKLAKSGKPRPTRNNRS